MLANGIFLSKLSNLIALWGGCGLVLRKSLQVIQNKVARTVTKLDWSTPTSELLRQMGWLSVNQLVFYHSALLMYKVKQSKQPKYMYNMYTWSSNYTTRQTDTGTVKVVGKPRLDVTKNSFRYRAAQQFNQLPPEIRNSSSKDSLKINVKKWIREHVPIS